MKRYEFHSGYERKVPLDSSGRFNLSRSLYDSFGRDIRRPYDRMEINPFNPQNPYERSSRYEYNPSPFKKNRFPWNDDDRY